MTVVDKYKHHFDFVNRDDEWESFDLTKIAAEFRGQDFSGGEQEFLYRLADDRWILVIILLPGHENEEIPADRELNPAHAAYWLRRNNLQPPDGLRSAPSTYDERADRRNGQNRLDRNWLPPMEVGLKVIEEATAAMPPAPRLTEKTPLDATVVAHEPSTETSLASQTLPEVHAPEKHVPLLVLGGKDDPPIVRGNTKKHLTPTRYAIVKVLYDAKVQMTNSVLRKLTHRSDPRKTLKALAKSDEDWAAVIYFPDTKRDGYGIYR